MKKGLWCTRPLEKSKDAGCIVAIVYNLHVIKTRGLGPHSALPDALPWAEESLGSYASAMCHIATATRPPRVPATLGPAARAFLEQVPSSK